MKGSIRIIVGGLLVFGTIVPLFLTGCDSGKPVAMLLNPKGQVQVKATTQSVFEPAKGQTPLPEGAAIKTGDDGSAEVKYGDDSLLLLRSNSLFLVKAGNSLGKQDEGNMIFKIQAQKVEVNVETPHGVTAVLGTTFAQQVSSESTILSLDQGKVRFTDHASQSKTLEPGYQLVVKAGAPLPEPVPMSPPSRESLFNPGASSTTGINR